MRIKTQLIVSMVILGAIFLIITASVITTNQQIDRMNRQEELANTIVRDAYELSYLSNDYLLHQENRQLVQWRSKFSSFSDDLTRLEPDTPEQQALVDNIRTNQGRINDVFNQVVTTIESPNDTLSKSADSEFIQVSWSRITVQNQGVIFDASQLSHVIHNESDKLQQNNTILIFALLLVLLAVLLFNFAFTSRRILTSLSNLQKGTQIIGSGNLDYAIDESSRDEIGELSHAFNQMTSSLKEVTASKTDLQKEVTERKRAEQSAKESLELYQTLAESAKDIIFICDPRGNLQYFNKNGALVFGSSVDDLIGKNLEQVFPPETAREQKKQLGRVLESKKPLFAEINIHLPTLDLWLDVQLIPLFTAQGIIRSVMGVARDITTRKQAEEKLTESIERFNNVARATNDVVWDWDLTTDLLWWNEAIYTVFGYQYGEIEETIESWYTRIYPEDRDPIAASIHAVIDSGGKSWSGEYRFRKADSSYASVLDRGFVIHDSAGKAVRMVGAMLDVTRRKRAEEELKNYSEKLEVMVAERTRELREAQEQLVKKEKLAVLGKLSGGVGHELRNPLGAIKNVAYFLTLALEKPDEDVREMIEILNKEVNRSEDIISSLLDFARPKAAVFTEVEIRNVMTETLRRFPVPQNITLVNNQSSTLPAIQADANQLIQIFGNLFTNAYQAMPEGGILTITSEAYMPGWLAVSVADTGTGVSDENMKKLFEPLFTTKAKGIGLGLVVIKAITEVHGGRIEVKSEAGKGAVFTVILPIHGKECGEK
jgi:PAS domain S-box-containing protein